MLVKDAMRSGCKSSMKRKLMKDVMRNRLQGCKSLKRGRVWEARRSTRLPSPVYMNFTCVYELHLPVCMDGKWPNGTGTDGLYL